MALLIGGPTQDAGAMIYRALTLMAGSVLVPAAQFGGAKWRARAGSLPGAAVPGSAWFHGASVGEITSALPLMREIARRMPVFVTANTATGRDAAAAAGLPAGLAPADLPQAMARFLDALAPRIAVAVESEFWPNRSAALAERATPQVLIGARLSARSAARWGHLRGIIAPVLGRLRAVSAQDAQSEARLLALGLPAKALLPRVNLKLMAALARPVLTPPPTRMQTLLAASTHEGEEALILRAVAALRARGVPLRLIIAPRHPQRFDAVAGLMATLGLDMVRRCSDGAGPEAPTLLADSMGEMDRWYAAAGLVFTGGSLVARGGHTPWEPAAQGCALLHGPHVANFAADYAQLDAGGAALAVTAEGLAATVADLMANPDVTAARGATARAMLEAQAGDSAPLLATITRLARSRDLLRSGPMPMIENNFHQGLK